jgi:hypothetical protein
MLDPVTTRKFNLYSDLLDILERSDAALTPNPPSIYAVTCPCRKIGRIPKLEVSCEFSPFASTGSAEPDHLGLYHP